MTEKQKLVEIRGWASNHPRSADNFLQQVVDLAAQGYVIHPKPQTIRQRPNLVGFPSVTMVTPEHAKEIMASVEVAEVIKSATNKMLEIEALTSKDQMLQFALDNKLEIPEDKKVPKAIQKWLLEQFAQG